MPAPKGNNIDLLNSLARQDVSVLGNKVVGRQCVHWWIVEDMLADSRVPCGATKQMHHQHNTCYCHARERQNNARQGLAMPS